MMLKSSRGYEKPVKMSERQTVFQRFEEQTKKTIQSLKDMLNKPRDEVLLESEEKEPDSVEDY